MLYRQMKILIIVHEKVT